MFHSFDSTIGEFTSPRACTLRPACPAQENLTVPVDLACQTTLESPAASDPNKSRSNYSPRRMTERVALVFTQEVPKLEISISIRY